MSDTITPNANFTGIITITASGTAVSGPDVKNMSGFYLKGHPSNTASVQIFDDNQSKIVEFPLAAGELIIVSVPNLNLLDFGADSDDQKICYPMV